MAVLMGVLDRTFPLVVLLLVGCGPLEVGPFNPTRAAYVPEVLRVGVDEPTAFAAVERYVSSMGWSVDEDDAANERVVAHADTGDGFTLQRDTWTFHVTRGFITVHRRLALGDTNATSFVTSDDVCDSYTYAAEEGHLAGIAALLGSAEGAQPLARR
jgi:hypothetical protein